MSEIPGPTNVCVVLLDSLNRHHLGAYGGTEFATPNLDRIGDIIACPPGGPETAHQLINTGEGELKYLAVSTKLSPELCEYPDSGKFGVMADLVPGRDCAGAAA